MPKYIKNTEKPVQKYRFIVQTLFAILCIWIGLEFIGFVTFLETNGAAGSFYRPPGVEGFLPISAMMSFYYFILSGEVHQAHPAGMFIFLSIISVSFFVGKAFCSWMCPIGYISEMVGDFSEKIQKKLFKRVLRLPRFIDYFFRSIKYLLLAFFVYVIFFAMDVNSLRAFLSSPYNKLADVKMFYFFADISRFALIVIAVLFMLSVAVRNFWCRYLCPYGALLGITSLISPNKIKRNADSCIDCKLCTKACPSNIQVHKVKTVLSDECSSCLGCVDVCPAANTLDVKSFGIKKINKKLVAGLVVFLFIAITGIGMMTGNWGNNISQAEYLHHYENIEMLDHPRTASGMKKMKAEPAEIKIDMTDLRHLNK